MKKIILLIVVLIIADSVTAQNTYYSIYSYDNFIPNLKINDNPLVLQKNLYPDFYNHNSVTADMRWVHENDSVITAFISEKGDTILHILGELSGFFWEETELEINLMRYFPTFGNSVPLIIPLGGTRQGGYTKAAPSGNSMRLVIIYELAHRILTQRVSSDYQSEWNIVRHPLMRYSPYRRDNLAMLLAISTGYSILGIDATEKAFESAWWKQHFPGKEILEKNFLNRWILTPSQTLAYWIQSEPINSSLVLITRPPEVEVQPVNYQRSSIEGVPLKGLFGFSVHIDNNGYLVVDSIDAYRLGYACGLRTGDVIRTVNQSRARNHKVLIEKIFETFEQGGATLQIFRDDQIMPLIIQPMILPVFDDEMFDDEFLNLPDSLKEVIDSTVIDSIKE